MLLAINKTTLSCANTEPTKSASRVSKSPLKVILTSFAQIISVWINKEVYQFFIALNINCKTMIKDLINC